MTTKSSRCGSHSLFLQNRHFVIGGGSGRFWRAPVALSHTITNSQRFYLVPSFMDVCRKTRQENKSQAKGSKQEGSRSLSIFNFWRSANLHSVVFYWIGGRLSSLGAALDSHLPTYAVQHNVGESRLHFLEFACINASNGIRVKEVVSSSMVEEHAHLKGMAITQIRHMRIDS